MHPLVNARPGVGRAAAVAVVVLLAVSARLAPAPRVFAGGEVAFLADGDPYYHVLRARELLDHGRVLWQDEGLNHPFGARVPWPPLFDALLALAAWIGGAGRPTVVLLERTAALVPVVLGVAGVVVGWLLARELVGRRLAILAGVVLALSPTHVRYSVVGRPDQHVLEVLLLGSMLLAYARGVTAREPRPRRVAAGALGVLLPLAFWTWLGSALHLAVLCALVGVEHVLDGAQERARRSAWIVGWGAAAGALVMAASVLWLGPPGALGRVALGGVSAFPAFLLAGAAAWCALLTGMARGAGGWKRRAAELTLATLAVPAILMASPAVRAAISRGLLAAGRGNSWYASIGEFAPLLMAPNEKLSSQASEVLLQFGLLPVLAGLGVLELRRAWAEDPARRGAHIVTGVVAGIFTILAAYMWRFAYYAALPLALCAALGVAALERSASRIGAGRARGLAAAALVVAMIPTVPALGPGSWSAPRFEAVARVLAPFRTGSLAAEGALLTSWDVGHHARYWSGRPVIASPFGTEGGDGVMKEWAGFFLARDPAAALAWLERRRVRWVLVEDPANAVLTSVALAGEGPPPVTVEGDRLRGFHIHCEDAYDELVVTRLFYAAGSATPGAPEALGAFRLVNDEGPMGGPPRARLFEVVPGMTAEVEGATPLGRVTARVEVRTRLGSFLWTAGSDADEGGHATLRLPYATGRNGAVVTTSYSVSDGTRAAALTGSDEQVRRGDHVTVDLKRSAG